MMGDTKAREADTAPDTGPGRQIMEEDKSREKSDGRQLMGDKSQRGGHSPYHKIWERNDGRHNDQGGGHSP